MLSWCEKRIFVTNLILSSISILHDAFYRDLSSFISKVWFSYLIPSFGIIGFPKIYSSLTRSPVNRLLSHIFFFRTLLWKKVYLDLEQLRKCCHRSLVTAETKLWFLSRKKCNLVVNFISLSVIVMAYYTINKSFHSEYFVSDKTDYSGKCLKSKWSKTRNSYRAFTLLWKIGNMGLFWLY